MRKWIYTESVGNGEFYMADLGNEGVRFVWLDKYGIANIFREMAEFMRYCGGDLDCERECVEPYETDEEDYDFIDDYLKIDKV